ncbi:MAG: gamma-glutamyl-gamma-aminobutyrate hydrolase family protein [Bacteroidota bacterium]
MRKILLAFLIVLLSFAGSCAQTKDVKNDKNRIILVNPGVSYLKGLNLLTEKKAIDIENLEFDAVFYAKSEISYDKALEYVTSNSIDYIKLKKIDGDLNRENLYTKNSCSDSYYELFKNSEGIIFLGGWDIPSELYTQKTSLLAGIKTPNRHYFELSFLYHLLGRKDNTHEAFLEQKNDYVVLGICLGMQTMNVATGGDMYQDIPSDIYGMKYVEDVLALDQNNQHKNYWRIKDTDSTLNSHSVHQIKLKENTVLSKIELDKNKLPVVISSHHQAVKNIGSGFKIIATSMDGKVVEAIQHNKYKNVIGLQFHPEFYGIHTADSKQIKMNPSDSLLISEHELLKNANGYQFNIKIWEYFSSLF